MPRRISRLLNLLVVATITLSGLLVDGVIPTGSSRAMVAGPDSGSGGSTASMLAGKRARTRQDRRHDRHKDATRDRKKDRKQADRKQNRKQDHKKSTIQEQGRIGDWQDYCSTPDSIQLHESELCTHGPDEAPAGFAVTEPVPLLSAEVASEQAATIACDGDGESGYRTQILYVRASDRLDKYAANLLSIQAWAAETDLIFRTSAAATGPTRSLRFVQDPTTCLPKVGNVVVSPAGDGSFGTTINELRSKGFNRQDRIYLLFVDATAYCGVGNWWDDDRIDGSVNYSNYGPSYARVDRGCWSGDVAAHEVMHTLGGVQDSAPNSSKGAHCIDEWDIMCYRDSPYYPSMRFDCVDSALDSTLLDCNHNDYYNTNPAPGSYLATHWNSANNRFLTNAPDPPPPAPAPPPPTIDPAPPDGSTTTWNQNKHKHKKKHKRRH